MNAIHRSLLVSTLLFAACGSKAPEAADGGAPPSGAPPTAVSGTTIEGTETGKAPPEIVTTAPEADTTTAAVEADTAAPAAPDTAVAAADPADGSEAPPIPADTPKVPGVAPEVVARLMTEAVGCVGVAKNGRALLLIASTADGLELVVQPQGAEPETFPVTAGMGAIVADPDIAKTLRVRAFGLCHTAVASAGSLVIPREVPITIHDTERGWIEAYVDGQNPVALHTSGSDLGFKLVSAYYSDEAGAVWVRMRDLAGDEDAPFYDTIQPASLGESTCVPRPVSGKPPEAVESPAFEAKPASLSCVAMTADGQKAAFKTFFVSSMEDTPSRPNAIEWFGPGDTPDIDLKCMLRGCKPEDLERITADAARLGLTGCNQMRNKIVVDGQEVPFLTGGDVVTREHAVVLKTSGGWRPVHTLRMGGNDGDGHESVWKTYQHPKGGPIYLYVGNTDTGIEEVNIYVLDDASMGLCPAPPASMVAAREVKVSSAQKDVGGYRFGVGSLTDGDPTTAWQAVTKDGGPPAWIEFVLPEEREIVALEIATGLQRRDGNGDMFAQNARAAELLVTFPDGSSETLAVADQRGMQTLTLAAAKRADRVKVTVTKLHEGTRWPKDLNISELRLLGP